MTTLRNMWNSAKRFAAKAWNVVCDNLQFIIGL